MKPSGAARTEILSRTEWESLWNELDENKSLPFHEYAKFCAQRNQEWLKRFPSLNLQMLSNGR